MFFTRDCIPRETFLYLKDEQNSSKDLVLKYTLFKNKSHHSTNKTFVKRFSYLYYEKWHRRFIFSSLWDYFQNRNLMEDTEGGIQS